MNLITKFEGKPGRRSWTLTARGRALLGAAAAVPFLMAAAAAQQSARSALTQQFISQGAQIREIPNGTIITPASSIIRPEDAGAKAHTNVKIFVPAALPAGPAANPQNAPPFSGLFFETPSSLACIYGLVAPAFGCNPNLFHTNATGGSKAIGIVDAYNAPNIVADLNAYSAQFGLPKVTRNVNFFIIYCGHTLASCSLTANPPPNDPGWAAEETLDVEMAHAMAPAAKIFLVEAASNSNADLLVAEDKASALVAAAGGGQVSNSWGEDEFASEAVLDAHFSKTGVVYFASSGDSPGTSWPAVSSKIVCVGGTSTSRNSVTTPLTPSAVGTFIGESTWDSAGGGPSTFIPRPAYQPAFVGAKRACPDISADANPETGVWVYCSVSSCGPGGPWWIYGGTSVASPLTAGIVNNAGGFKPTTTAELSLVYAGLGIASRWYDVKQGYCGRGIGSFADSTSVSIWAATGYDFCSGVGSPRTRAGK
jgi:subtilase family serine protease